jgi:hypothetical protein
MRNPLSYWNYPGTTTHKKSLNHARRHGKQNHVTSSGPFVRMTSRRWQMAQANVTT